MKNVYILKPFTYNGTIEFRKRKDFDSRVWKLEKITEKRNTRFHYYIPQEELKPFL